MLLSSFACRGRRVCHRVFVLSSVALAIVGCFVSVEFMWLNRDGAGLGTIHKMAANIYYYDGRQPSDNQQRGGGDHVDCGSIFKRNAKVFCGSINTNFNA